MRILLVYPGAKCERHCEKDAVFPNGLLFLAAVLEKSGHEVQICDNVVDSRKPEDFITFSPGIVGFSVLTGPDIAEAIAQSIKLKSVISGVKVVWGGVHPSLLPEQTLSEPYIDYIVIGAGEYTLLELVQHLENGHVKLEEIKGLAYKKDGKIFINEPRPFIKNLDSLPDPAWHLIDVKRYFDATLHTSRGCPFRCTFCVGTAFHKGSWAGLSAERIVSQIGHLQKRYGVTFIRFFEDNFTFNRKRLREFCNLVIRKKLKVKWDVEARADLNEEDIALMAKSGCVSVRLGVETGSQRMLTFLKKGTTVQEMEKTFWCFVKHKIAPRLYLMEAVPTETFEDFVMTRELLERLDNPPYRISRFVPYPGTPLFNYCVANKLIGPPEKLAHWASFTSHLASKANLSDVPDETIDDAIAIGAIAECTRAIELDPDDTASYFKRGNAYRFKGEYGKAIADFTRALELDPNYVAAYNNRGAAYRFKGEYGKAIADFTRALELDPNYAVAYNNRGAAYRFKGEYGKAIADFTRALELDPNCAAAYNNRGAAYGIKGEHSKALADFTRAIELDPSYAKDYLHQALPADYLAGKPGQ